jgi:hypothetical protein
MIARRSPAVAVLACAAGGLLVLLASGRRWSHTTLHSVVAGAQSQLSVTGHSVEPALPALGIALLALSAAILAANGALRRLVGAVVVLVAAIAVATAIVGRGHVSSALEDHEVGAQGLAVHASANGWWLVVVVGGLLGVAGGVLTVVRAHAWSGLAAKYDGPTPPAPTKDPATLAWDALDRGEDPTRG